MQSSHYYQSAPQQQYMMQPPIVDSHITTGGGGGEDDDSDGNGIPDKRSGRRKIKIEYISDKSRRHITFSKRKAGIMKKAYELSTLTGTQVLLLVVSETGLVYTFTTPKLQPLVTKPEGKNLIQSCLNTPDSADHSGGNGGSSVGHHHQPQAHHRQAQDSRIMSTSALTSSPTISTATTNNYYRPPLDPNAYNEDRKQNFGSMTAPNTTTGGSSLLNNTDPQLTSGYPMNYSNYNNPSADTSSSSPLYSYSLPPDNNNTRFWNNNNPTMKRQNNTAKR